MFFVGWSKLALDELANIWLDASGDERAAINSAVREIDTVLRIDPAAVGESRDGDRRVLIVPPLSVIFHVEPMDRAVHILHARYFRQQRPGR